MIDQLRDSFYGLQRAAAPGVDRATWQASKTGLDDAGVRQREAGVRRLARLMSVRQRHMALLSKFQDEK
jgi:hypothetical protein